MNVSMFVFGSIVVIMLVVSSGVVMWLWLVVYYSVSGMVVWVRMVGISNFLVGRYFVVSVVVVGC